MVDDSEYMRCLERSDDDNRSVGTNKRDSSFDQKNSMQSNVSVDIRRSVIHDRQPNTG